MPERGLFVHPNSNGSGTSPQAARKAIAGLLAPVGALGGRLGVLSGMVVTGNAGWTYTVGPGHVATGAGTGEAIVWANGESAAVSTSAAPGSGSRIDVIWARHTRALEGDASSEALLGVESGVATTGTPVAPSIPAGAVELARATVPSGATGTSGATIVTTSTAYTAARGCPIPVTGTGQRNAITWGSPTSPARVWRIDTERVEVNSGSGWVPEGVLPSRKSTYSGSTAIGSSTTVTTAVPFNGIDRNNGISFDGTTQDFTAPVTGRYAVTLKATLEANATGNRWLVHVVNGSTATIMTLSPGTASNSTILSASDEVGLTAGDKIRFGVRQSAGVSLNLTAAEVVIRCVERV